MYPLKPTYLFFMGIQIKEKKMPSQKQKNTDIINVIDRQIPLMKNYKEMPKLAWIVDTAKTTSHDVPANEPMNTRVHFASGELIDVPVVAHPAVGGNSELPTPGHIFAGAIASCLDVSIRMIANRLELDIEELHITVDLGVDVRGTLCMDKKIPVGFQRMEINIKIVGGSQENEKQLGQLLQAAEHSCILLQTLRNPPQVTINHQIIASQIS